MNAACVKPNSSSSESEHSNDEIWDDTLIIRKYDESLAMVKEEVAKRLAMKTNKKMATKVAVCNGQPAATAENDESGAVKHEPSGEGTSAAEKGTSELDEKAVFKPGEYYRATYDDGVDYEIKILAVKEGDALIRYIGYNNEQTVPVENLVPSWGRKARRKQREDAAELAALEDQQQQMEISDDEEKLTKKASKIRINYSPSFRMPKAGPAAMPPAGYSAGPMGMGASFMVPPPPPMPPMLEDEDDLESENLSAMLMSWYMSGYYTGLYHGQKMSQKRARPS
ncbi:survival motor neuron protein [Sabethes cyaneus]|uniref:survival motor neuron protein n=1 Tax=Sabethes cyaneus TaxID=53552 RepID=UPI00237E91D3|nr:survival motor neuron protein [Sabethes cyaneus]